MPSKTKGGKEAAAAPPAPPRGQWLAGLTCDAVGAEDLHGHVPNHPESPDRLAACLERLRSSGYLRSFRRLPRRLASDGELGLCHTSAHIAGLVEFARLAKGDRKTRFLPTTGSLSMGGPCCEVNESAKEADTYVNPGSLDAARASAGGVLQLVDEVMQDSGGPRCGLALCRPPGHHASRSRSSGFCLVNNVAVAAAYARTRYPEIERVLIFDWDVHHGQGTQQIFEQDPSVLFVSVHRHDGQNFYPATGHPLEVGTGAGRGYSVNVALPGGYGDAALWTACVEVLLPAARRFQPQLILVSAGFDAASGDPLGTCSVSPQLFGTLTTELRRLAAELCHGRLILALEGGYNPDVLADCVEEVSKALLAQPPEGAPFAEAPSSLAGSACFGAVRRTCEAHEALPLKLVPPLSKNDRKTRPAPSHENGTLASAAPGEGLEEYRRDPADGSLYSLKELRDKYDGIYGEQEIEDYFRNKCAAFGSPTLQVASPVVKEALELPQADAPDGREVAATLDAEPIAPQVQIAMEPEFLVVRISPVPAPTNLEVSEEELRVWFGSSLHRWRFEGVRIDSREALREAKFRPKRHELSLRLPLGQIIGGSVALTPTT